GIALNKRYGRMMLFRIKYNLLWDLRDLLFKNHLFAVSLWTIQSNTSFPAIQTRWTVNWSSNRTKSAVLPDWIDPQRSSMPRIVAGVRDAMRTASNSGTSPSWVIVRTKSIIRDKLPDNADSSSRRAYPGPTLHAISPSRNLVPSGKPAPAKESDTSAIRSGPFARYVSLRSVGET